MEKRNYKTSCYICTTNIPNIKFTMQVEKGNKLAFLGVLVRK